MQGYFYVKLNHYSMKPNTLTIFTDGSSRGNPGPGGWGAVVIYPVGLAGSTSDFKVAELGGREDHTTNNRMEIAAAVGAFHFIESRKVGADISGSTIEIHTDSAYLLQGITLWVFGWEKNGWKTKTGDDVLNQDLWRELFGLTYRLKQKHKIEWIKVSGHTGHNGNERADDIATNAALKGVQILYVGGLSEYEKLIGGSVFSGMTEEKLVAKAKSSAKKKSSKSGKPYSYVSMVDGTIKTHTTWSECEARVKGTRGARFQKVFSKDEEASLTKTWKESARG